MVWTANWGALPLGLAPVRFILRQEAVRRINGLCRYVSRPGCGGVGSFERDGRMVIFMDPVGACRSLYNVF